MMGHCRIRDPNPQVARVICKHTESFKKLQSFTIIGVKFSQKFIHLCPYPIKGMGGCPSYEKTTSCLSGNWQTFTQGRVETAKGSLQCHPACNGCIINMIYKIHPIDEIMTGYHEVAVLMRSWLRTREWQRSGFIYYLELSYTCSTGRCNAKCSLIIQKNEVA